MIVSVIMPTYNRPDRLNRAVESFRIQKTTITKQLIILDNGSNPPAKVYQDENIITIRYETNINPHHRIADYIDREGIYTFLYDDDQFYDCRSLQARIEPIINGYADVTYSDAEDFGTRVREYRTGEISLQDIIKRDCIYMGTMAFSYIGWINSKGSQKHDGLILQADWLFKINCLKFCRCKYVPEITLMAEIHQDTESIRQAHRRELENKIIRDMTCEY